MTLKAVFLTLMVQLVTIECKLMETVFKASIILALNTRKFEMPALLLVII